MCNCPSSHGKYIKCIQGIHMYIYCIYIYIALEWDTWQTKLTMEIQWNITTALKLTYHNMVFQHSYGTWPIDE